MNPPAKLAIDAMDQCDTEAAKAVIAGDMDKAARMYAIGNNLYQKGIKQIPGFQQAMDERYGKITLVNMHKLAS